MLILCDFDGTLTEKDVTNLILDRYTGTDWRATLLPPYREGKITHLDVMVESYKLLTVPEAEMVDFALSRTSLRPGFDTLRSLCKQQGWPLVVVSGGVDVYIKAFLPPEIPFHSYTAILDGYWKVGLPPGVKLSKDEDFKVLVLGKLKEEYPGIDVIFIGDGPNDLQVARQARQVFAVKNSRLAELCEKENIAYTEFNHFGEVAALLERNIL